MTRGQAAFALFSAQHVIMPREGIAENFVTVQDLIWKVTLNSQSGLGGHSNELFWLCPECLRGSQYWTLLCTVEHPAAHAEKGSDASFSQQPPKHFGNGFEASNTGGLSRPGQFSNPDSGIMRGNSGYFEQAGRDSFWCHNMQNAVANNGGGAPVQERQSVGPALADVQTRGSQAFRLLLGTTQSDCVGHPSLQSRPQQGPVAAAYINQAVVAPNPEFRQDLSANELGLLEVDSTG